MLEWILNWYCASCTAYSFYLLSDHQGGKKPASVPEHPGWQQPVIKFLSEATSWTDKWERGVPSGSCKCRGVWGMRDLEMGRSTFPTAKL